jgi:hypothetical protein
MQVAERDQRLPKTNLRRIFKSAVDFHEYCNAHAHPVFLAGRDSMAGLQIVHGRVSLPAKKNFICTKQRFLLNAEFGTEVFFITEKAVVELVQHASFCLVHV